MTGLGHFPESLEMRECSVMGHVAPRTSGSMDGKKRIVSDFFDNDARFWKDVYEEGPHFTYLAAHEMKRRLKVAVESFVALNRSQRARVLDAGCGAGELSRTVAELGHDVFSMDLANEMLSTAREKVSENGFRPVLMQGDIEHLPFEDESLDAVFSLGVLQYLPTDEKAVGEIGRVLKKDGLAIISLPNMTRMSVFLDAYYLKRIMDYVRIKKLKWKSDGTAQPDSLATNTAFANRKYTYGRLNQAFLRARLVETARASIGFGPFLFLGRSIFSMEADKRISDRLEGALERFAPLKYLANRWVITLRKR